MSHLLALTAGSALDAVGRSLKEAFFMFWETLWALVLGFALSGAVQAFVSRRAMQRQLGDHRPLAVLRASGYGMVSSSCSYAASAMAKSLFQRGADFITSMVFMFASTNLVIELGIVLLVLMGWQFMAAEFIGGPIMVVLLVLAAGFFLGRRVVADARRHMEQNTATAGAHEHHGPDDGAGRLPWRRRIRTAGGWADAAAYAASDLNMLRRELVIGYVVAGFLAVLVPTSVWNAAFVHGHGFWTSLENAIVGPFIALISFVCSIGNVPLAAALWHGGIAFGGVVSFIFADLISLPLVLIYRRFYGGRVALRLMLVFWGVMSLAGLATEGIFSAAGWIPHSRPANVVTEHFSWNYTTVLNIIFLLVLAALSWAYRNRERLGGGDGHATDPVCAMQVEKANAPASLVQDHRRYWFCSDHCCERFAADPGRFLTGAGVPAGAGHHHEER